jgi:tripartite-type tricarboxylate transporter receptor subunit TctC
VSVLRQDVQFVIDFFASMKAGLLDNKIRPLATTGMKRLPFLPDVPTVDESGLKGFEVSGWNALYAPVDTPKEAMDVLVEALRQVMVMPDVQKRLLDMGIIADPLSPEAQTRRMTNDIAKWRKVIQQAKIPQQ